MGTSSAIQTSIDSDVSQLYETYHRQVLGYLIRLVHDREVAEDLCQDTFLKAWSGWTQHKPDASAAGWLYRIATNTAYDHVRRTRRICFVPLIDTKYVDSGSSMDTHLDMRATVQQALERVSDVDRVSLVLSVYMGYTAREIARIIGCSDAAVRIRLYRARIRFQQVYHSAQEGAGDE